MADKLTLEDILNKIYYDGYTFDDLKEYIFPTLKNMKGINHFFDVLFNTIRVYSEVKFINKKILNKK